MRTSMFTLFLFLLTCFCAFVIASTQNSKSTVKDTCIFPFVQKETRERLKERLQILVEFQKAKDYEKLYDLMAKKGTDSKESFVKTNTAFDALGRTGLLNFFSKEIYLIEPGNNFGLIRGCGEYIDKGKKKYLESQVEAIYENDDWYFSSLVTISSGFGTKAKKCSVKK